MTIAANGDISTTGTLTLGAGLNGAISVKTSGPYTVLSTDFMLVANSGSAITFNLPALSGVTSGRMYVFKNKGAGVLSLTPNGTDTIDGVNTSLTVNQWQSFILVSDGATWNIK